MQQVIHNGIVTEVFRDHVSVVLNDSAGCSTCQLKSACGADSAELKEFTVNTEGKQYKKGDLLTIGMSHSMGLKAVLLAYVVPFIILMAVLLVGQNIMEEWMTGLLAIVSIAVYYIILKRLDKYLSKYIHIQILKTT
ncbi:MAG: hypothetical protein CSA40_01065 [Flavobacteriales bacterium]|nr:MAG: hypothetical protein CSA40_01065 [Flavobacteriales bacterium]